MCDLLFQLLHLVAAVLALAELLLDRLELLVQIVLALRLLHLTLDPVADPLLHLEHADLAFHEGVDLLEPFAHGLALQQLLLLGDLQAERCEATVSASLLGSSIWLIDTRTSGGIFLLSLMYCSNWATAARPSASIS